MIHIDGVPGKWGRRVPQLCRNRPPMKNIMTSDSGDIYSGGRSGGDYGDISVIEGKATGNTAKHLLQNITGAKGISDTHNPYEWVGEYHNEGLDYVFDRLIAQYGSLSSSQAPLVPDLVAQYIYSKTNGQYPMSMISAMAAKGMGSSELIVNNRVNRVAAQRYYPFEHTFYTYSDQILSLTANADGYTNPVPLYNTVIAIEDKVIADPGLSEVSKAVLLSTASVFRNSLAYWYAVYRAGEGDPRHPHHKYGKKAPPNKLIITPNSGAFGGQSGTGSAGNSATGTGDDGTGTGDNGTGNDGTGTSGSNGNSTSTVTITGTYYITTITTITDSNGDVISTTTTTTYSNGDSYSNTITNNSDGTTTSTSSSTVNGVTTYTTDPTNYRLPGSNNPVQPDNKGAFIAGAGAAFAILMGAGTFGLSIVEFIGANASGGAVIASAGAALFGPG